MIKSLKKRYRGEIIPKTDFGHASAFAERLNLYMKISESLIERYNVPAPRYTSYPTVPLWEEKQVSQHAWERAVRMSFEQTNVAEGVSLYIHLPYCESLCTYCACNTRITKNHAVEERYIKALHAEWALYKSTMETKPRIREIHLGGGTPTFFSADNLSLLISGLLQDAELHPDYAFSFEGHPNNTTAEHLQSLYDLGFRRVSYGVQDLNRKVQVTINRLQPFENVERAIREAREMGYESVNVDLIYGLPFQTLASVEDTMQQVLGLRPDRIAFYSYAHVPWKRPGQRSYTEADLPDGAIKRMLYERGKSLLQEAGYLDIGMDHFALPGDELYKAYQLKTLHRNFMGYTTAQTELLIGLGASAISDANGTFVQNARGVEDYLCSVEQQQLPLTIGHLPTDEDQVLRQWILDLTCTGELNWATKPDMIDLAMLIELNEFQAHGIIRLYEQGLRVSDWGMAFIRNICMVFDKRLRQRKSSDKTVFSKAI